jgi:hypothetical protein
LKKKSRKNKEIIMAKPKISNSTNTYAALNATELKKLLEDRKIVGRSNLTTKPARIEALIFHDLNPNNKEGLAEIVAKHMALKKEKSESKSKSSSASQDSNEQSEKKEKKKPSPTTQPSQPSQPPQPPKEKKKHSQPPQPPQPVLDISDSEEPSSSEVPPKPTKVLVKKVPSKPRELDELDELDDVPLARTQSDMPKLEDIPLTRTKSEKKVILFEPEQPEPEPSDPESSEQSIPDLESEEEKYNSKEHRYTKEISELCENLNKRIAYLDSNCSEYDNKKRIIRRLNKMHIILDKFM